MVLSKPFQIVALSLLTVLALSSCTKKAAHVGQKLWLGNGAEPKDLDPHITTGVPEHNIMYNLFEGLVGKDPKTLEPIPGVAESWKVSKDGKTYTFKLRQNAKWSNGDPVTAQDFVYSWTRLLEPKTAAEYAYQAHYIKGGKEYTAGTLKDASQLGIKALDAHTLQIELVNPTPFFLGLLFHHSLSPVHRASIEKHGNRWTRPGNMVSNGAFMLKGWEMNKEILVVPNPNYWNRSTVKLEEAHFIPTENRDTEEKMFRSGELDIAYEIPIEKLPYWQNEGSGAYQNYPYLGTYFYLFNTTKKPINDKRVRRALALAIDREKLVKFVVKGGQMPATMYTPPGTGGYQPPSRLNANLSDPATLTEAKKLLAEAGYPNGKGVPPIEIHYNTHDGHKKIAEAIQEMWKKNLGIDVKLFNEEWKVYLNTQKQLNYFVSRMGWIADYNDPNTFLDMYTTGNGNNRTGWSNAKYDSLIAAAAKEQNAEKRKAIFKEAESILLDELPVMPIYIYTRIYLKRPYVKGWYPNVEDIHPLQYVSMER